MWYLADIEVDTNARRATLLINRSDRLAADQSISSPKTKEYRVAEKNEDEGNDYSAHLSINLKPTPSASNMYAVVLEDAPGLNSGTIVKILDWLIKECSKTNQEFFTYKHPDGSVDPKTKKDKTIKGRYSCEMVGHPSEDFVRELNDGVLHGIEIISYENKDNSWDGENKTIEHSTVVNVKPKKKLGASVYDIVKSVCKTAQEKKLQEARIKFKDSAEFERTVLIDINSMNLKNEEQYVKKERLTNFSSKLPTSFQRIYPGIRDRMYVLIK